MKGTKVGDSESSDKFDSRLARSLDFLLYSLLPLCFLCCRDPFAVITAGRRLAYVCSQSHAKARHAIVRDFHPKNAEEQGVVRSPNVDNTTIAVGRGCSISNVIPKACAAR